ncbi:aldolase [Tilletiaria anomala UBC 951]|uniref:Aldolase n=1 Tax=Tilletiaria anomala (strain ATCC 24038 / CBS 436.72 / UBC 951) TaxID=1037660 RepID=A0A066V6J5_TILAU|nr:aldolase [Tilletiaria anomala UBC 951]KDN37116.1 aldolase [Tilletiaria anomala UBC 951]
MTSTLHGAPPPPLGALAPTTGTGNGAAGRSVPPPAIISRALRPGIYAPVPTFFTANEELDLVSFSKHVVRLAQAGVFPVISGSTGEAPHLTPPERTALIKAARSAFASNRLDGVPIIAGANGSSLKHSIELAYDAASAGADAVIVIPSGYFAGVTNTSDGKAALREFYIELANHSPIPILIYNYPGASGGINMDSDFLIDLAKSAPNTCGLKLTCNEIGKLLRICSVTAVPEFATSYPRKFPYIPFLVFTGYSDTLYPALIARGAGAITGLANLVPHTVRRLFDIAVTSINAGSTNHMIEAQALQSTVAQADFNLSTHGIAGIKWALSRYGADLGYDYTGGLPRKPLPPLSAGVDLQLERQLHEIIVREKALLREREQIGATAGVGASAGPNRSTTSLR